MVRTTRRRRDAVITGPSIRERGCGMPDIGERVIVGAGGDGMAGC
jgi:hypothetical protein